MELTPAYLVPQFKDLRKSLIQNFQIKALKELEFPKDKTQRVLDKVNKKGPLQKLQTSDAKYPQKRLVRSRQGRQPFSKN